MSLLKNQKHEIFAQNLAAGKSAQEAGLAAGYSKSTAVTQSTRLSKNVEIQSRIVEIQQEILNAQLVDAAALHRRWSEMWEADIADILSEDGKHFRPVKEWPRVWRLMLDSIDIRVIYQRSRDGERSNWDAIGEIVRLRFIRRKELSELLAQHRKVDA